MVQIKRNDKLYYARITHNVRTYEVCDLVVRTVKDSWFSATDIKDKRAYLFDYTDIGKTVFYDRQEALNKVVEAEKSAPINELHTYYEEY